MPIDYVSDKGLGLSVTVIEGTITPDEWRAHVRRQLADPDWPAGPASLTDARGANAVPNAQPAIEEMAAMYAAKATQTRNTRFAAVATSAFENARDFEETVEPGGTRSLTVTSLDVACAWLCVDRDTVDALIQRVRASMNLRESAR